MINQDDDLNRVMNLLECGHLTSLSQEFLMMLLTQSKVLMTLG